MCGWEMKTPCALFLYQKSYQLKKARSPFKAREEIFLCNHSVQVISGFPCNRKVYILHGYNELLNKVEKGRKKKNACKGASSRPGS